MAGRGRGRGRGLLAAACSVPGGSGSGDGSESSDKLEVNHTAPTDPGPYQETKAERSPAKAANDKVTKSRAGKDVQVTVTDVQELVENLYHDLEDKDLQNISNIAEEAVRTGDDLEQLARFLYNKSLTDIDFAKNASVIGSCLSNMERDGRKFRNILLMFVQTDFKVKEKLQEEESGHFIGLVTVICQIYANIRLQTGERFQPLVTPIFDLFELILRRTDSKTSGDEYECLSTQLLSIGKELEAAMTESMQNLMEQIRLQIINNQTSPRIRCHLLEVVETYGRKWEEASNDIRRFYLDTMADVLTEII